MSFTEELVTTFKKDSVQSLAFSSSTATQSKEVFAVSLTVKDTFVPQLQNKTSPEFRAKSKAVEEEVCINSVYFAVKIVTFFVKNCELLDPLSHNMTKPDKGSKFSK